MDGGEPHLEHVSNRLRRNVCVILFCMLAPHGATEGRIARRLEQEIIQTRDNGSLDLQLGSCPRDARLPSSKDHRTYRGDDRHDG